MSFLTSLFLVAFLIVGPCLSQDSDPFVVLQSTLEAIGEKQDIIIQRLDEQERHMEIQEIMLQDCRAELNERKDNSTYATLEQEESQSQCPSRSMGSNCKEVLDNGGVNSGVYTITPKGFSEDVKVYCDQITDGGGWVVILRRQRVPPQVHFNRTFEEYATGFGNPKGELWIGNRVLHSMTGDDPATLRVEATGVEGQYHARDRRAKSEEYGGSRYGIWETFSVGGEDTQFRLSVGGFDYNSTLGNALSRDDQWTPNNMQFSTFDRDNDPLPFRQASLINGYAGWWFNQGKHTNPTSPLGDTHDETKASWDYWNSNIYSFNNQLLSTIQMKIRP